MFTSYLKIKVMENNTFTFWASKNQVPFIQKQFEHRGNLTVLDEEEDNIIKLELRVTHGVDLYYLFCAGVDWMGGISKLISK